MLDLGVCGTSVDDRHLRQLVREGASASPGVDCDSRRDRQHPGPEMLGVLEPVVGAEGAKKRLLEGILRGLPGHSLAQEAEHDLALLEVEALERRDRRHCVHHHL